MLHEFLATHRSALIERCRLKVVGRRTPKAADPDLQHGIPMFLEQLIKTLRVEQTGNPMLSRKVSGPADGSASACSEIGGAAAQHGRELLVQGFTVDQVVHDYGDLCQAITEMAFEAGERLAAEEFQTVNRCLDNAIADAVTEFTHARETLTAERTEQSLNERLGFLAHELRNLVHSAKLAFAAIKTGNVGPSGATGAVVDRSLLGLCSLIDRTLADVRVTAKMPSRIQRVAVADFVSEIKATATLDAEARGCHFTAHFVDPRLGFAVDRELMLSAVGNLLQNAFKFTKSHTEVSLHAYGIADRVRIDVEDACGGLPSGLAETMFLPFTQGAKDKSGLGLGLAICRRIVEASQGELSARDLPGVGCVFSIDLPRQTWPDPGNLDALAVPGIPG